MFLYFGLVFGNEIELCPYISACTVILASKKVICENNIFSWCYRVVVDDLYVYGGAILVHLWDVVIKKCTFSDNEADVGGDVAAFRSSLNVSQSTFTRGYARQISGSILAHIPNWTNIRQCNFTDCEAVEAGAIKIFRSPTTEIIECAFHRNICNFNGGAICLMKPSLSSLDYLLFVENHCRSTWGLSLYGRNLDEGDEDEEALNLIIKLNNSIFKSITEGFVIFIEGRIELIVEAGCEIEPQGNRTYRESIIIIPERCPTSNSEERSLMDESEKSEVQDMSRKEETSRNEWENTATKEIEEIGSKKESTKEEHFQTEESTTEEHFQTEESTTEEHFQTEESTKEEVVFTIDQNQISPKRNWRSILLLVLVVIGILFFLLMIFILWCCCLKNHRKAIGPKESISESSSIDAICVYFNMINPIDDVTESLSISEFS